MKALGMHMFGFCSANTCQLAALKAPSPPHTYPSRGCTLYKHKQSKPAHTHTAARAEENIPLLPLTAPSMQRVAEGFTINLPSSSFALRALPGRLPEKGCRVERRNASFRRTHIKFDKIWKCTRGDGLPANPRKQGRVVKAAIPWMRGIRGTIRGRDRNSQTEREGTEKKYISNAGVIVVAIAILGSGAAVCVRVGGKMKCSFRVS